MDLSRRFARLAAILAFAAAGFAAPVHAEEWRFSTPTPAAHIYTRTAARIAHAIGAEGKDRVTVAPANQLGDVPTVLSLLQGGALQLAVIPVGDLTNRDPAFFGWFLPRKFDSLEGAAKAAHSKEALEMLDRLGKQGLVGLAYVLNGQRHVLSRKPIASVEDFRNLKVRAFQSDIFRAWWSALGAAPTALPLPEIMPSLITGVIDAVDVDLEIVNALRMYEQAPHVTLTRHMVFPGVILASRTWWERLDPARQEKVRAVIAEAQQWALDDVVADEAALVERLAKAGAKVAQFDGAQFSTQVETVRKQFIDRDPLIRAFDQAN